MTMNSSDYLLQSSREYAIYVLSHRAIPNVQDGLKHGQRIALWLLRSRAEKLKTFALSGLMGYERLYVHGEVSANDAIGKLAAPYNNNVPLIEGLGQFGNRVAPIDGIGAPRYTEVRRSKAAEAILYRDLDLVPLKDNYDGSNKEPVHFLPLIPTVLLNGVTGIAVGWSTSILPRSLKGLIQATQDAVNEQKTLGGMEPFYERFTVKVKNTGPNQWEFSGRAVIEDTSTVKITELPPGVKVENFRKKLNEMEENDQIVGYTDRSKDTINITIRFKRGTIKGWREQEVLDFFGLKDKVTERIVVIDWNGTSVRPYETPEQVVRDFAAWRLGWYTERYKKMVADTSYDLTYWQALKALFDAGFTKKLGTFPNRSALEDEVTTITTKAKIKLDDTQLDRVVSVPTYRWTKDFEQEVIAKIAALKASVADYQSTLKSSAKLKAVYIGELEELKKLRC
jgi:DNA gyrase/topoisomerase IV subunit A